MSYNVDELFGFARIEDGYSTTMYLKANDPSITELEIPEEYKGAPITEIRGFSNSKYLKAVKLPGSVKQIHYCAFESCPELERVELNSAPRIGLHAFGDCPKLPPETVAMGLVGSTDLTRPISEKSFNDLMFPFSPWEDIYRFNVFELLAKNGCFREIDPKDLLYPALVYNKQEIIPIAGQYGLLEDAELVDKLLSEAVKDKKVECTAYLLDLKRRKFGFDGGGDFGL